MVRDRDTCQADLEEKGEGESHLIGQARGSGGNIEYWSNVAKVSATRTKAAKKARAGIWYAQRLREQRHAADKGDNHCRSQWKELAAEPRRENRRGNLQYWRRLKLRQKSLRVAFAERRVGLERNRAEAKTLKQPPFLHKIAKQTNFQKLKR